MNDEISPEQIKKATLDHITGFENRPEFVESTQRCISKSSHAGKTSGVYMLRINSQEELPTNFIKHIAKCLRELDFDHTGKYENIFAMLVRISNEADNNLRMEWMKDSVKPVLEQYNYTASYADTLTQQKDKAEDILSELERKTLTQKPEL